ncbi:MAG: tyrosine-type recombinase/integrase [Burkholderiales bacterium]|nr:tyrosine-type recombinase/integrase [Burkholderiales bacterium]
MAHELHKVSIRGALKPRREPYWDRLGPGQYLGFRKIAAERGSWIARLRDDAGIQNYKALGADSGTFGYEEAKAAALAMFAAHDAGVKASVRATVEDACRAYVKDREREKGDATARDAEARFQRTVYGTDFGRLALDKVRTPHVRRWRDGLALGKASSNRTLAAVKAALNYAVSNRMVPAARAIEWRDVRAHKNASQRRALYLDLGQRRALIAAAGEGGLRDLIEAAALTGARPGELVRARRAQFDARTGSLTLTGKTGSRTIPLSAVSLALFTRLARGKLPNAHLLVRDDGRHWAHSDWDQLVKAAAERAKLPTGTVLYTLRHSFITQALVGGMATLDVARLTGTSLGMIERHYGHLVADAARERLDRVAML